MSISAEVFVTELAGMYGYHTSTLEATLWETQVFQKYPAALIISAIKNYMESGKPEAKFMPKYFQILELLTRDEAQIDLLHLDQLVRVGSPYVAPQTSGKLAQVIHELGGWVRVCAEFPDAQQNPMAYSVYAKRFEQALSIATKKIDVYKEIPYTPRALGVQLQVPSTESQS